MDIREQLQNISNGHSARLSHAARRRVVLAGVEGARRTGLDAFRFGGIPQMALAAGLVGLLALPAFFLSLNQSVASKKPVSDLSVSLGDDGQVVLAWTDGDAPRKVVRVTNREELKGLSGLPGEAVRGEQWIDTRADQSDIVYYIVE